jgi:hypothetical protein
MVDLQLIHSPPRSSPAASEELSLVELLESGKPIRPQPEDVRARVLGRARTAVADAEDFEIQAPLYRKPRARTAANLARSALELVVHGVAGLLGAHPGVPSRFAPDNRCDPRKTTDSREVVSLAATER